MRGRAGGRDHVVGWELPGHGRGAPPAAAFGVADLARGVLDLADRLRPGAAAGYAGVCEALAGFDVRARLAGIGVPVVAVAGGDDRVTPTAGLAEIASGVRRGRLVVLDGVAHLAPAERPAAVAALLREVI
ncbi:alpha/beta fold hydrolase [Dactylosporangium sp. McL0621]|uniref:alpha/beta fold hydrolase n=1 Tax=Dactylosporangium sp. McL0621 TaxID=3415678 RepID=UPI003CF0FE7B